MAVVPESITLSRSSRSSRLLISLPPAMTSSSSRLSFFGVRGIQSLPGFKGLRIQSPLKSSTASSSSLFPKVSRPKTNIVCEAQDTALDFPTVNDTTWHSVVLNGDGPVLVEFWAPWCGPCRILHPLIAELAQHYTGKLKCFKLNTDECPTIATQYGIRSIPTIMIFINGEKKETVIGAVPISTLTASIEKFL